MTAKIEALIGDEPKPFEYGNIFGRELAGGHERLRIGVDTSHAAWVQLLASGLQGPFQLLYVLHTTRTGAELARYESPELSGDEVHQFFRRFGRFMSEDARHDVWVRSHDDDATIVLDRHNLIYAYGPLEAFEAALSNAGTHAGLLPEVPGPHVHHYHREWDDQEREVLRTFAWIVKPLQAADVQFREDTNAG